MNSSEPKKHFTVNKIIVLAKISAHLGLEPRPLASKPMVPLIKVLLAVAQNNKRSVFQVNQQVALGACRSDELVPTRERNLNH